MGIWPDDAGRGLEFAEGAALASAAVVLKMGATFAGATAVDGLADATNPVGASGTGVPLAAEVTGKQKIQRLSSAHVSPMTPALAF